MAICWFFVSQNSSEQLDPEYRLHFSVDYGSKRFVAFEFHLEHIHFHDDIKRKKIAFPHFGTYDTRVMSRWKPNMLEYVVRCRLGSISVGISPLFFRRVPL